MEEDKKFTKEQLREIYEYYRDKCGEITDWDLNRSRRCCEAMMEYIPMLHREINQLKQKLGGVK